MAEEKHVSRIDQLLGTAIPQPQVAGKITVDPDDPTRGTHTLYFRREDGNVSVREEAIEFEAEDSWDA